MQLILLAMDLSVVDPRQTGTLSDMLFPSYQPLDDSIDGLPIVPWEDEAVPRCVAMAETEKGSPEFRIVVKCEHHKWVATRSPWSIMSRIKSGPLAWDNSEALFSSNRIIKLRAHCWEDSTPLMEHVRSEDLHG